MKVNCAKCQVDYEKSEVNDSIFCLYCRAETNVKTHEILWAVCLVFGFCALGLFLPFLIFPLVDGTDGSGQFVIRAKKQRTMVSPVGFLIANLVIGLSSLTLLYLSTHFKRKLKGLKMKLSEMKELRDVRDKV